MNNEKSFNADDLIKKIDDKIAELEKKEDPKELLKSAFVKLKLMTRNDILSNDGIEKVIKFVEENKKDLIE